MRVSILASFNKTLYKYQSPAAICMRKIIVHAVLYFILYFILYTIHVSLAVIPYHTFSEVRAAPNANQIAT